MLVLPLCIWWYSQGWLRVIRDFAVNLQRVLHIFSVPILLRTLWAPWRRIITYPGASIDAKLRALGDNLVSRCIGFTVRMLVLIAALLIMLLVAVWGAIWIVVWPFIPVFAVVMLIKGVIG